jgi:hypothetical protein
MEILQWLESSEIILYYDVIDYRVWNTGRYYKLTIYLKDKSVLFVKEYFDFNERNYSFHWQDVNGKLLIHWDNSPYHSGLTTHPLYKHISEKILESYDIYLSDVLKDIERAVLK